jgi:hypothetical protein
MRQLILPAVLLCAGCTPPATPGIAFAAGDAASVAVFGRDGFDLLWSAVTGRDCSVVRLDRGLSWCRPPVAPPAPPQFCARSLGTVDCWADPAALPDHPPEVADGPTQLTAAQAHTLSGDWP